MSKKKTSKRYGMSLRHIGLLSLAVVLVSGLVGVVGAVKANNDNGDVTISGSAQAIIELFKGNDLVAGSQSATFDEEVITKINSLCLATDQDGNPTYQNCEREFIGMVGISSGTATSTPLIVKNTWAQPLCFSDLKIIGQGLASSSIFAWYGTSTEPNPFTSDPVTYATATLDTTHGALAAGLRLQSGLVNGIITNASTTLSANFRSGDDYVNNAFNNLPEVCIAEGEYFTGLVRAEDPKNAATSTSSTGADSASDVGLTEIVVSVKARLYSTSTQQY